MQRGEPERLHLIVHAENIIIVQLGGRGCCVPLLPGVPAEKGSVEMYRPSVAGCSCSIKRQLDQTLPLRTSASVSSCFDCHAKTKARASLVSLPSDVRDSFIAPSLFLC